MQLDLLWNYAQLDMKAMHFESDMRKAPNRVKLMKLRDQFTEQKNSMKKIEDEIAAAADRIKAVEEEIAKSASTQQELQDELADAQDDSIAELDGLIEEAERISSNLSRLEKELVKLHKSIETKDAHWRSVRTQAVTSKAEFDKTKEEYDVEFKQQSDELKVLKEKAEAAAKSVPSDLLSAYWEVKQHSNPPMAQLLNGQCGGCHMSLPSATIRTLAAGDKIIKCDNCGAILYAPASNTAE